MKLLSVNFYKKKTSRKKENTIQPWLLTMSTQLTFTCSKSAIETLEKGVTYVQSLE